MLESPVVLVTGASRGIGKFLAQHYLEQNCRVIGFSRGTSDLKHGHYTHFKVDVQVESEVVEAFQTIRKQFGRLDVTINNAAVNPTLSLGMMTSFSAAAQTIGINFLGTFLVSRESAKLMMRKKFGRIVNLSSMAVRHEVKGESIYSASKAAVTTFSRVFAKEVYESGITCNVVAPSAIPTEMMAAVDEKALQDVLKRNAIPKMGEMKDVANTVDWLIKPESQSITGQVIYLGGC